MGSSDGEQRPAQCESKLYGFPIGLLRFERRVVTERRGDGVAIVIDTSLVATRDLILVGLTVLSQPNCEEAQRDG